MPEAKPLETGRLSTGERSSEAARQRFREEVLDQAICPICRSVGLSQFNFAGTTTDGQEEPLDFAVPVMTPEGRMFPIGGLYLAACRNCGYIAQFLDVAVEGRNRTGAGNDV